MDELAKKFADLAVKYGPDVVEAARGAVRIEAYSKIQIDIIMLLISAALIALGRWWWKKNLRDNDVDLPIGRIGSFIVFVIASVFGICAIGNLTDPWLWTAMSHPDLWIAKRVFHI